MFSGVSIPHRDSFLSTPLPRHGDSREGLLSALKGVIRKKAKQGGPFSFEIENTETRRTRNQGDAGILQQGFPLGGWLTLRVYRGPGRLTTQRLVNRSKRVSR